MLNRVDETAQQPSQYSYYLGRDLVKYFPSEDLLQGNGRIFIIYFDSGSGKILLAIQETELNNHMSPPHLVTIQLLTRILSTGWMGHKSSREFNY